MLLLEEVRWPFMTDKYQYFESCALSCALECGDRSQCIVASGSNIRQSIYFSLPLLLPSSPFFLAS